MCKEGLAGYVGHTQGKPNSAYVSVQQHSKHQTVEMGLGTVIGFAEVVSIMLGSCQGLHKKSRTL